MGTADYLNRLYLILAMIMTTGTANSAVTQPAVSDNRPLRLISVKPDRTQVPQFEKIEFVVDLQATYSNAFDPDEIKVDGSFTTPGGKTLVVPGFYIQDYTRQLQEKKEALTPKDKPGWRIRFSGMEAGRYRLVVTVRDRSGNSVKSSPVEFKCIASRDPGFVRVSSKDKRYFAFDNGQPYVPIGANVCWGSEPGTFDYEQWLPRYGKSGCNYIRLWLGPGWTTFALERKAEPKERYGVGKFDLANLWRLDFVMDLAAKNGLYVMLCMDSYNELRKSEEGGYPYWDETPHNAKNGGPLNEPRDFWTNPEMLRLYRNKLRYLVARFGWDPHVLSWEFWNEVDIISPTAYIPNEVTRWHAQMSDYLRNLDPWKHLQTTSFAHSGGKPEIDRLQQMDYIQTHSYGVRDSAQVLVDWQKRKEEEYGKPHFVGEFGSDSVGDDSKNDPDGTALHNGIWSTLCSGSAGAAMLWWWDSYIHPRDLYYHFDSLAKFIKGLDFPREGFKRVENAVFSFAQPLKQDMNTDLLINGPAARNPALRLYGMRGKTTSLLWVQNTTHAWSRANDPKSLIEQPPSILRIPDWPKGRYQVVLWDTYAGKELDAFEVTVDEPGLKLELPAIQKDIAIRLERLH